MKSLVNSSLDDVPGAQAGQQPLRVVADGVQQVGLAQSGVAVDEQRVVRLGRRLGDRDRGRMGEPVARADDEGVEGVLRVQPGVAVVGRPGAAAGRVVAAGRRGRSGRAVPSRRLVGGRRRGRSPSSLDVAASALLVRVLHGDGDPDVAAEFVAEDGGDQRPQPVLEVFLGEVVRRGEQGGVLDQAERPGEVDPGLLLRADRVVVEAGLGPVPDIDEFGAFVHGRVHSSCRRSCAICRTLAVRPATTSYRRRRRIHRVVHRLCMQTHRSVEPRTPT